MGEGGGGGLTGLNRTQGSADLSARQTFGRPKVQFNPYPPIFLAAKNGRKSSRTFGQPKVWQDPRPAESPVYSFPPYTITLEVTPTLMQTPCFGSLRSMRGLAPAPPLNNKTPAVAIDRLLCAPPYVCVHSLVCAPPCLWSTNQPPATAHFA